MANTVKKAAKSMASMKPVKKKKSVHGLMKPIKLRSQAKIIPMEVRKQRNRDVILILDFGSQYTQLIARRIRESKVFSQIVPFDISPDKIKEIFPKGIILSGGPLSVYSK